MPATIVAIDQKSLASLGQWPWHAIGARATDRQHRSQQARRHRHRHPDAGSRRRFAERMPTRVARVDPALAAELATVADERCPARARARRRLRRCLRLPVAPRRPVRCCARLRSPSRPRMQRIARCRSGPLPVPQYSGAIGSVEALARAARAHGLISVEPAGGVIRRIPLVASIGGTLLPAFAIEMIRVAIGAPSVRLLVSDRAIRAIAVGDFMSPTEADGAARLHYSPHNNDRYVSAVDVLDGRVRSGSTRAQAGAGRRDRRRHDRRQDDAARRADARRRDPCAASGKPLRRDVAAATRMGAGRRSRGFLRAGSAPHPVDAALEAVPLGRACRGSVAVLFALA